MVELQVWRSLRVPTIRSNPTFDWRLFSFQRSGKLRASAKKFPGPCQCPAVSLRLPGAPLLLDDHAPTSPSAIYTSIPLRPTSNLPPILTDFQLELWPLCSAKPGTALCSWEERKYPALTLGTKTVRSLLGHGLKHYTLLTLGAVLATQAIANVVKSSFGPSGLDKMMVDDIGVRLSPNKQMVGSRGD
jgi:hypothetical protein